MNTVEAFRTNQAALEQSLKNTRSMSDANVAIQVALERTAATLAQSEADEITRQRYQTVLSVAKQSTGFLMDTLAEGKLVASEPEKAQKEEEKKQGFLRVAGIAGLVLLAFLAVYEMINGKWMFALLGCIAILLLYIGRLKESTTVQPKWRAEGEVQPNSDAIVRTVEELCRAIDIAVSDLSLIDREQSARAMGSQEDALLDLMSALMEAKASGREDLALESLDEAEQTLHRLGMQAVQYTPERAGLFDVLPTHGESRTVRPALMSGERILRRGVAAVKVQEGVTQ